MRRPLGDSKKQMPTEGNRYWRKSDEVPGKIMVERKLCRENAQPSQARKGIHNPKSARATQQKVRRHKRKHGEAGAYTHWRTEIIDEPNHPTQDC